MHMPKILSDNDDELSISSHTTTKNESNTRVLMPLSTFMGSHQDYKDTTENMQPVGTGDIETDSNYSNQTGTEAQGVIADDRKNVQANNDNEPSIAKRYQEECQEGLSAENLLTQYHEQLATSSNISLNSQRYVHPLPEKKPLTNTRFLSEQQTTTVELRTATQNRENLHTQSTRNKKRLIKEVSIPKVPELPVAKEDKIEGITNVNLNWSREPLERTSRNINENEHLEFTASSKTRDEMVEKVERRVSGEEIDHEKCFQSGNTYEYQYSQMSNGVFYLDVSDEEEFII